MASDLGEEEATSKLVDIYERGEIAGKVIEESERLRRMLVTQFQKSTDGLEWISQEDKTLFIRGNERMINTTQTNHHGTTRLPFNQWLYKKELSLIG